MEKLNNYPSLIILTLLTIFQVFSVRGQISTPCTSSMMSNIVPCIGYIMGGSKNGASPTSSCCDTVNTMMSKSMDCVCLIVTGNVPLPSFVSQALAITLPQACGSMPLQCKSSGVTLPPPGPVLFAPPPPAAISPRQSPVASPDPSPVASSPLSPKGSKALALLEASVPAEAPMDLLAPAFAPVADVAPRIRPVFTPYTSASGPNHAHSSIFLFSFIAITVFSYYQDVL